MSQSGKTTSSKTSPRVEMLRAIVDKAPQGIIVFQGDDILFVNAALAKMAGYPLKEVRQWKVPDFLNFISQDDSNEASRRLKAAQAGKIKSKHYELRIKDNEGNIRWINAIPQIIQFGEKPAVLAIVNDITEQKQTELAYHELIHNTNQGLLILQEGGVAFTNEGFAVLSGYTVDELLNFTKTDVANSIHPDFRKQVMQNLADRLEGKSVPNNYQFQAIRKDGSVRWLEIYASLVEYRGKPAVQATFVDITDHVQAKAELQDSEIRYRTLVEDVPLGLYRTTPDGQIIDANPAIIQLLGAKNREALIKHNAAEFYINDDERLALSALMEKEQVVRNYETQFRRLDGSVFWVRDSSRAILDSDGKVKYYEGILEDITEQKQVEEALRESETRYRTLVETSPDSITMTDLKGRIIFCNEQAVQIYGAESELELIGMNAFEFIVPEDQERALEGLQKTLREGKSGSIEYTLIRKDGSQFPAELNASVIVDAEGKPKAFIGILRDITERKRAEALYRGLYDSVPVGLFRTTPDGEILDVNPALFGMLGFSEKEHLLKRKASEFYVDPQARKTWEAVVAKQDVVTGFGVQFRRQDGKLIWIELSAQAIRDSDGKIKYYEGTLEDVTERKQAELAIQESEAKYRALVEQSLQGTLIIQDERIVFANRRIEEIIGIPLNELISLDTGAFWSFIPSEDEPWVHKRFEDRLAGKAVPDRYDLRIRLKSGAISWIEIWVSTIEYLGAPAIQVSVVDITERKRAEQALMASEAKYRNLVEQSTHGILITSGDPLRIYFTNTAYTKIIGYSIEELLSFSPKKLAETLHPEDRELVMGRAGDRMAGKPVPASYEYRIIHKNGGVRWIEVHASLIEFEGEPAIQSIISDITERKEAEKALLESEEKFRALVEEMSDWVWEFDTEGRITYSNNAVEDIIGYSMGQVVGRTPCEFIRPEDEERAQQMFKELVKGKRPIRTVVIRFLHRDGSIVILEARGRPILDEFGELLGFRGICRDITDRLKMLEQLRALEERY